MNLDLQRTGLLRGGLVLALLSSFAALPLVDAKTPFDATPPVATASPARPVALRPAPTPTAAAPRSRAVQPLVFVVHPTRPALSLEWREAFDLIVGGLPDWRRVDGRPAPLRLVLGPVAAARAAGIWLLLGRVPASVTLETTEAGAAAAVSRDPAAIGLIVGDALSPAVRAASVGGVDPLRAPAAYPLRVPAAAAPGTVTTAIAVGDIMTSRTVDRKIIAANDFLSPFRLTGKTLAAADITFGNFEGTISHDARPRPGGTSFVSRVKVIDGFRFAGIDFLSLANNHIGDYGAGTLSETVTLLRDAGIAVAGAGADLVGAREPAILVRNGVRFAFVAFNAIIGTPQAGPDNPGAVRIKMAPWFPFSGADLAAVVDNVKRARRIADVVIVYPHWGAEYTAQPNADQKRVGRAMIDAGADMVIATHPHWVQGAELYKGRLIAYSLGNFVFDQTWSVETEQGAVLELTFWGPKLVGASFVPVQIEDAHRPRFVDYTKGAAILNRIWEASGAPYAAAA